MNDYATMQNDLPSVLTNYEGNTLGSAKTLLFGIPLFI